MSPPIRLTPESLGLAPEAVARPGYDRAAVGIGVVHLGPGAFHRAHQAAYLDRLLETDPRWGVCAVSLKSPGVRNALAPQDGLYALVELGNEICIRIIGAMKEILVASEAPHRVLERLASAEVRLITLTVTEKGYDLDGEGRLDLTHPDIRHDLARPPAPASAVGWLVEGLRRRRDAGRDGPIVLSCDNLSQNGRRLRAAVLALAEAQGDAALAAWIEAAVAFPCTMVDAITPATDEALRRLVQARLGLDDAWPVQRESFSQWVVEDRLAPGGPDLAAAGVILADDVRPFEEAKLRLLNGAHSSLAYIGLLHGFEAVAEAMAHLPLARFIEQLMRRDLSAGLAPAPGLDLAAYISGILDRFRNPALSHRLAQIAGDGSQKLPVRLIPAIQEALAAGRPIGRLCLPVAAWMAIVVRQGQAGAPILDPIADKLAALAQVAHGPPEAIIDRFLGLEAVFPRDLASVGAVRRALAEAYARLAARDFDGLLTSRDDFGSNQSRDLKT